MFLSATSCRSKDFVLFLGDKEGKDFTLCHVFVMSRKMNCFNFQNNFDGVTGINAKAFDSHFSFMSKVTTPSDFNHKSQPIVCRIF